MYSKYVIGLEDLKYNKKVVGFFIKLEIYILYMFIVMLCIIVIDN